MTRTRKNGGRQPKRRLFALNAISPAITLQTVQIKRNLLREPRFNQPGKTIHSQELAVGLAPHLALDLALRLQKRQLAIRILVIL